MRSWRWGNFHPALLGEFTTGRDNYQTVTLERPDTTQFIAWQNCFETLQVQLHTLVTSHPASSNWTLVFEYELPRERGRRPDLAMLTASQVLVLEFKEHAEATSADLDQVSAYARDLHHYHAASHDHMVRPILVPMASTADVSVEDDVVVCPPGHLADILRGVTSQDTGPRIDPAEWLNADYAPLPTLITAARLIFDREPLPQIKRALSAGVPDTVAALVTIARAACVFR